MQCRSDPGFLLLAGFSQCSLGHEFPCAWSPSGMLLGIHGQTCAEYHFYVQNGNYKGQFQWKLQISAVFCCLDPDTWRLAVPVSKGLPVAPVCPYLPGSSVRKHLKPMDIWQCLQCRFTANVQHNVHSCCDVHLVSSLHPGIFDFSAHESSSYWALQCGNSSCVCWAAERGVHIQTYPCRTNVSEGLIKIKKLWN